MEPLSREEALVGVAMCAAWSDGTMAADEDEHFADHVASFPALAALDEAGLREAIMKVDAIARKEGDDALLSRAAAAVPAELRATAFYLGADLVLADGELADEEKRFLARLQQALGVPDPLVAKIVDVVLIRNQA